MLLDDGYWPAFSTVRSRSTNAEWEYIGEGFIKEMDFSRVRIRLNVADEGDKDEIIGEWKGESKVFLSQSMVRQPPLRGRQCGYLRRMLKYNLIGWPYDLYSPGPRWQ